MSESGKNVKSRSREERSPNYGSTSSKEQPKCKFSEEEIFDSGIQSECLSSGVISETDLNYDSGRDCDSRSFEESATERRSPKDEPTSKADYKSQVSAQLDSGCLDVDVPCEDEQPKLLPPNEEEKPWENPREGFLSEDQRSLLETIFEQDDEGNTRLHLAILQGCEEFVDWILLRIPNSQYLDIRNHNRETCLHLSVLMDQPKITRTLLLAGAETGVENRNGDTALHLACKMNNPVCVEVLLHRLLPNEQIHNVFKYRPVIDWPSAYINEYNYDGLACIHIAAAHPDLKVLNQLFVYGCDVNNRECKGGYTVLHTAVRSGNITLVKFILQHPNVEVDKRNYARSTPYQLSKYHDQIARILVDKGADERLKFVDDDESEDDDSSDESGDDESLENSEIESGRISNHVYSANTVITTAS